MGFFSNVISAAVKTAITPIAIVKDVANVAMGEDADATKELIESATDDVSEAIDEITGD